MKPEQTAYHFDDDMAYFVHWYSVFKPADDDIDSQRATYEAWCHSYTPPLDEDIDVIDTETDNGVALRLYRPQRPAPAQGWPWVVYLHGGMWTYGSLDSHEYMTAPLCKDLNAIVIAVDYRLAPEAAYPDAQQDCQAALEYVMTQAQTWQLNPQAGLLMGDDAGANLALELGRSLKRPEIKAIVAINPNLEVANTHAEHPILSQASIRYFWNNYANSDAQLHVPEAADMSEHVPTVFFVPEYDASKASVNVYAEHLQQAKRPVSVIEGPGMVHGCLKAMRISPAVKDVYQQLLAACKPYLS